MLDPSQLADISANYVTFNGLSFDLSVDRANPKASLKNAIEKNTKLLQFLNVLNRASLLDN